LVKSLRHRFGFLKDKEERSYLNIAVWLCVEAEFARPLLGERILNSAQSRSVERLGSDRVEVRMKRTRMFSLAVGTAVFAFAAHSFGAQPGQAELMKQSKITKAEAEQIALAKVPHGSVKTAEIEKEKGHLVWSFDIARPGTRNITEILVDAKTGKIISTQTESPRDQAKEAAADKKQN